MIIINKTEQKKTYEPSAVTDAISINLRTKTCDTASKNNTGSDNAVSSGASDAMYEGAGGTEAVDFGVGCKRERRIGDL